MWLVMQTKKVVGPESDRGIGPTTVIAEVHFESFGTENFHNSAYLTTDQACFGHVAHQSHNG